MKFLSFNAIAKFVFTAILTVFSVTLAFGQETVQPTADNSTIKIGVPMPKAAFTTEGVDNAQMAAGIRELVAQYLHGSEIEIVPLEARLDSAVISEAREKGCKYLLNVSVSQKKGGGGFGSMLKTIAPVASNIIPMAGMAGGVAGAVASSVASTTIMTAANMASTTKSKDQFTLEYSLKTADGAQVNANSFKAKAKSDGEDVLSPMMEKMAEAILANAK